MAFSVNRTDSFPDIVISGLAAGATSIHEGHIPFAAAVPPVKAGIGNGFVWIKGFVVGYDGSNMGYQQAFFSVSSGSPPVINSESFAADNTVSMAVNLLLDSRGDLVWTVQNTGTKAIDCIITGITVQYVQP
jgi:hypothetical protein